MPKKHLIGLQAEAGTRLIVTPCHKPPNCYYRLGQNDMTILSRLKTPVYKATGSIARDHLASERTFLAWLRTGLGLIALGIAIERFTKLEPAISSFVYASKANSPAAETKLPVSSTKSIASRATPRPREHLLVGALLGTGGGSIIYGATRYFSNLRVLEQGLFRPAYFGAGALGVSVAGLAGLAAWGSLGT